MHDTKPTPAAERPQTTPAGTTADKGANETAPALRECWYCLEDEEDCLCAPPKATPFRSVMHGDPSMLTPGEIAERRTMRYVEPPDHRITCWGGVTTLEDAQD
jgi:hypothetical protein